MEVILLIITNEEISAGGLIEERLLGTYRLPNAASFPTTTVGNVPLLHSASSCLDHG
jgi:hypothetical protein